MTAPTKIMVYGVTGAGKSTLASEIGKRLGLPYHSVDDLTWEPGWIEVPAEVQRSRIAAICSQSEWVIDSAYGSWLDIPLPIVDLIVGLDYPRWLSLSRLVRRSVSRTIRRTTMCNGNVESLRALVSTDSILVWHFKSFKRKQRRMRQWQSDPAGPAILLFRSPKAVRRWLDGLTARAGALGES